MRNKFGTFSTKSNFMITDVFWTSNKLHLHFLSIHSLFLTFHYSATHTVSAYRLCILQKLIFTGKPQHCKGFLWVSEAFPTTWTAFVTCLNCCMSRSWPFVSSVHSRVHLKPLQNQHKHHPPLKLQHNPLCCKLLMYFYCIWLCSWGKMVRKYIH